MCSGRTCMPLMSFSDPSQVSPTTGRLQKSPPSPRRSTSAAMSASWTTPTECVFVIPIGEVSIPHWRIHSSPVSSPFPFSRCEPAKTGSSHGLPSCGRTTVTPGADRGALDQRRVADADARDVRDRVVPPRWGASRCGSRALWRAASPRRQPRLRGMEVLRLPDSVSIVAVERRAARRRPPDPRRRRTAARSSSRQARSRRARRRRSAPRASSSRSAACRPAPGASSASSGRPPTTPRSTSTPSRRRS